MTNSELAIITLLSFLEKHENGLPEKEINEFIKTLAKDYTKSVIHQVENILHNSEYFEERITTSPKFSKVFVIKRQAINKLNELRSKQQNEVNEESGKWYDRENAKKQYEDYPNTKCLAVCAIIISGLAVCAAVLELVLDWNRQ